MWRSWQEKGLILKSSLFYALIMLKQTKYMMNENPIGMQFAQLSR